MSHSDYIPTRLPRLVLIADRFTIPQIQGRIIEAIEAGSRWIHLRDHDASAREFEDAVRDILDALDGQYENLRISVNTHLQSSKKYGLDLHVGRRGMPIKAARQQVGSSCLLGYSAHSVATGRSATKAGANYLFFSPIFSTKSKPGVAGVGVSALETFCSAMTGTPVFALGGITPDRVRACLGAGVYGVAVLSGVFEASNIQTAIQEYDEALASGLTP